MKYAFLLALIMFIVITLTACQSSSAALSSWHPSELGDTTPLNIHPPAEELITMVATFLDSTGVSLRIQNDSDWKLRVGNYTVEVFTRRRWRPIDSPRRSSPHYRREIDPSTTVDIGAGFPNFDTGLPLEPGRYRVRQTVQIVHAGGVRHELVAEFNVTGQTRCPDSPWHPSWVGLVETPLNIFSQADEMITMEIIDVGDFGIDVIIENNSYWRLRTPLCSESYVVEIFLDDKWLPIVFEFLIFGSAWGPDIAPDSSIAEHFYLPNYNRFPNYYRSRPHYSRPLEPGLYRLRRTVFVWGPDMIDVASHELVAEFSID